MLFSLNVTVHRWHGNNSACVSYPKITASMAIYARVAVASRGCRGFQLWTNYAMCTRTKQLLRARRHMPAVFRRPFSVQLRSVEFVVIVPYAMWRYTCPRGWTTVYHLLFRKWFWSIAAGASSSSWYDAHRDTTLIQRDVCVHHSRRRLPRKLTFRNSSIRRNRISCFRIDRSAKTHAVVIAASGGRNFSSPDPFWIERHAFPAAATRIPRLP